MDKINQKKIDQIKQIASLCLSEKWEKMDCNDEIYVYSGCEFCNDALERKKSAIFIKCSVCLIPKTLCNNPVNKHSATHLMEIINYYSDKEEYSYIDDITHLKSYKLMVKCLQDLSETGKIRMEYQDRLSRIIKKYEKEVT